MSAETDAIYAMNQKYGKSLNEAIKQIKEVKPALHTEYRIERSRNRGEFWSRLYHTRLFLSLEEAYEVLKKEQTEHPSDWFRIVKVEMSYIKIKKGNMR